MIITLTIRVIKSFPYRNIKNLVIQVDPLLTTVSGLFDLIMRKVSEIPSVASSKYDTLKIYTQPHGTKTQNLVINFKNDEELIFWGGETKDKFNPSSTLKDLVQLQNETEISLFAWTEYEEFKKHPETTW